MATSADMIDESHHRSVTAAQVVFANLEAAESPHGNRGFQIAFYTHPDLDLETIRTEIQPSLFYYRRSGYEAADLPQETVYFRMKSGRMVLIRITPMFDQSDPSQLDMFGRPKTLFAHALVFEADDFRDVCDNDPFPIFDSDPFFRSYQDVLDFGGRPKNIHLDRVSVTIRDRGPMRESQPFQLLKSNRENLRLMLLLASHASNPRERRYTLQFDGTLSDFVDFLRDLLQLLPPSQRAACSFDTLFVGDDGSIKSSQSPYWANGVAKGQMLRQPNVVRFQLETGRFLSGTGIYTPETPYESWLDFTIRANGTATNHALLRTAATLQDLCWARTPDEADVGAISLATCQEFVRINEIYIRRLILKNLQKFPGPGVAEKLLPNVETLLLQQGPAGLGQLTRRISPRLLIEWLLPEYWNGAGTRIPEKDELAALEKCLDCDEVRDDPTDDSRLLTALVSIWKRDWRRLATCVDALSDCACQRLVSRVVELFEFYTESRVSIAPANGALGFYTFVSGQSRGIPARELTAALLGFVVRDQDQGTTDPADESTPKKITERAGKLTRHRWDLVCRILHGSRSGSGVAHTADISVDALVFSRVDDPGDIPPPAGGHPQYDALEIPQLMAVYRLLDRGKQLAGFGSTIPEGSEEIRDLLVCDPPRPGQPVDIFFIHTVGRERRAVVGRANRYVDGQGDEWLLLHALLPDLEEFREAFANNPFHLLDSGLLRDKAPGALLESQSEWRRIKPVTVSCPDLRAPSRMAIQSGLSGIPPQDLRLLLLLAGQTRYGKRKFTLCLLGRGPASVDFLRSMFDVIPLELRLECSFHTWCATSLGSRLHKHSDYWAVGLPLRNSMERQSDVPFDIESRRFLCETRFYQPETPFEWWVHNGLSDDLLGGAQLSQAIEEACAYDGLCHAEPVAPQSEIIPGVYAGFVKSLRNLIVARLTQEFGAGIAEQYVTGLIDWHLREGPTSLSRSGPWLLKIVGPKSTDTSWLLDWLVDKLTSDLTPPTHEVLQGIEDLVNASYGGAPAKRLLSLMRQRWQQCWNDIAAGVSRLDGENFRRFVRWCLRTVTKSDGLPFQVNWLIQVDSQGRLQFGPVLRPSLFEDHDYLEARYLFAALLGREIPVAPIALAKQIRAPLVQPRVVDEQAVRHLPELVAELQLVSGSRS